MTPGQRRAARRAAATGIAAAVTWGVTGLPGKALLRGPLGILAVAAIGNLAVQAKTSAKAYSVESRLNAHIAATAAAVSLVTSGGTVAGDLHVTGSLYGTGGTLSIADATHVAGALTADSTITTHTAFRGSTTTGDGGQGAAGAAYSQPAAQATINRVNDLLAALG
jgi:hypothetical protein